AARIHFFDLGLDTHTFCPAREDSRRTLRAEVGIAPDAPVRIAVKRALPMNRTLQLIQAFLEYADTASEAKLIVLCGDADADYVHQVRQLTASSAAIDKVLLVDEWLDAAAVAR